MSDILEDGHSTGVRPKRSLREELASLRIERAAPSRREAVRPAPTARGFGPSGEYRPSRAVRRKGVGRKLVAAGIWLIPLTLVGGLAVFMAGRLGELGFQDRPEVSFALVQKMSSGEAEKLLTAKGYLQSHNQALVGAKVPGRIESLLVEEGQKVRKGDLLAVLEHPELEAALTSRLAEVRRAQANLSEAEADFSVKDRRSIRVVQLRGRGTASLEELEQATGDRDMAAARVAFAHAAIALAESQVAEARRAIENMKIYAPFGGTILKKEAEVGETISTMSMGGSNTRSAIANLADLQQMEVETDVSENLLSRLTIGQPAEIEVSAVPDRRYRGRLQRVIPMGDRTRGTIKVMVTVLEPDEHLFPDLVANVHFLPAGGKDDAPAGPPALFVSRDAIVQEGGRAFAWAADPSNVVHKRTVEVAEAGGGLMRVDKGLEAGEKVVLNPTKALREGQAVAEAQ